MATTVEDVIARLKTELEEARRELDEYTEKATHPPEVELGGGSPGYSTWQTQVVLRQLKEDHVAEIEEALERAGKGLYGICEECGEPIPPERLDLMPFTTHCVACAGKIASEHS
jgi:DnaK suppressor protein